MSEPEDIDIENGSPADDGTDLESEYFGPTGGMLTGGQGSRTAPSAVVASAVGLGTVGLLSFFAMPWRQLGFLNATGIQLAADEDGLFLRAVPGAFLALALVPLLPRRVLIAPATVVGTLLVGLGTIRLMRLATLEFVGYGVWIAMGAMVALLTIGMYVERLAHRGSLGRGRSGPAIATAIAITVVNGILGFSGQIAVGIRDQLEPPEDRAIRLVQTTSRPGLMVPESWKDFAEGHGKGVDEPRWMAREVEPQVFVVSFVASKGENRGRGLFWEARLRQGSVSYLNDNDVLGSKYGLTRQRDDVPFDIEVGSEVVDTNRSGDIIGRVSGKVTNRTGKTLVSADLSCALIAVFSDTKAIRVESGAGGWMGYSSARFERRVSADEPWRDGETRAFSAKTADAIEKLYAEYEARSARVELTLSVEDPIDYRYDGAILVVPLEWNEVGTIELRRKLRQLRDVAMKRCAERWPKRIQGKRVTMTYAISEVGRLEHFALAPGDLDSEWTACVEAVFRRSTFPPPADIEGTMTWPVPDVSSARPND